MRVLVRGGRGYGNVRRVFAVLDMIHHYVEPIDLLIHGACSMAGADLLAERWAQNREIAYYGMPARWRIDGRSAGPRRNRRMLTLQPDLVVAFPGGPGTADMVRAARDAGVLVLEVQDR